MKREVEGWEGVSLREHVENAQKSSADAQQTASDARDLAEDCCGEQLTQAARLDEIESRLVAIEGQADV